MFIGKGSLMGDFMPVNARLDGRGGKLQVCYNTFIMVVLLLLFQTMTFLIQ